MSYQTLLDSIPPSGGGGCHPYLLKVANAGVREGHDRDAIFVDIRSSINDEGRRVTDREIYDTIDKAMSDKGSVPEVRREGYSAMPEFDGQEAIGLLTGGSGAEKFSDLVKLSPTEIPELPHEQLCVLLKHMYKPEEFLFFGDDATAGKLDESVRKAQVWRDYVMEKRSVEFPKLIINPLDGAYQATKSASGGSTLRGDNNITEHRYCLFEADDLPLKTQLKLWHTIITNELLPVAAVVYSGSKSLHAMLRVGCKDSTFWDTEIRNDLYPKVLIPLGADAACKNPARLSRLAGYDRGGRVQRLLWLA